MSQQDPTIGIRVEVDDSQAQRRLKALEQRLKIAEAVNNTLEQRVMRGEKNKANAVERGSTKQINSLRRLRWELITIRFYYQALANTIQTVAKVIEEGAAATAEREGTRALGQMFEVDVGAVSASLRDVANETLSVQDSIQAVQAGLLKDQGQFVNEYANLWEAARTAAVTAGGETQEWFEAFLQDLVEGKGEATDAIAPIYNLQLELHKYAEALGTTVDQLDPMTKAQVELNAIMSTTDELLANGADQALAQKDAVDQLKATWANYKSAVGAALAESLRLSGGFEVLNQLLTTTGQIAIGVIAALSGLAEFQRTQSIEAGQERFEAVFKRAADALGLFNDEVDDATYTYERFMETPARNYDALVDHLIKRQELIEQHLYKVEQIELKYEQRQEEIQIKYEQRLAKAERQAEYDRARAQRQYERKVIRETEQYHLKQQQELEDHLREMMQREHEFRLDQIQKERMYQYERGLLVAYGDVLAIEDLDARYALEKQSDEENHQFKQQSEEEDFQDEQRHREEQFTLQLEQLRDAYEDQLEEITHRLEERMLEAEEMRKEELRRAEQDYNDQLAAEQHRHEESLENWDQYWAKLAEKTEISSEQVTAILQEFFGEGGEADQIMANFAERMTQRVDYRSRLVNILGPETKASTAQTTYTVPRWSTEWNDPRRGRGYQFGGEGIARAPMSINLGEGGTPERFSIQPLAAMNSQVSLSWSGGPIPVQGTGLGGADTSAIGQSIAQGLIVGLSNRLQEYRR